MTNSHSNAATLARRAGVPCPKLRSGEFCFAVWVDGPRWGHIDLVAGKVTEFDGNRHVALPLAD